MIRWCHWCFYWYLTIIYKILISCFNHIHPLVSYTICLWKSQNSFALYQGLDDALEFSFIRGKVKRFSCNNLGRISDSNSPKGVKYLLELGWRGCSYSCMVDWFKFVWLTLYKGWLDCYSWYAWKFSLYFWFWSLFFLHNLMYSIGSWLVQWAFYVIRHPKMIYIAGFVRWKICSYYNSYKIS